MEQRQRACGSDSLPLLPRIIKLGDFGSARSAESELEIQGGTAKWRPDVTAATPFGQREAREGGERLHGAGEQRLGGIASATSMESVEDHLGKTSLMDADDGGGGGGGLYARPMEHGGGFRGPLTRAVCTPCYRAPEVCVGARVEASNNDPYADSFTGNCRSLATLSV